MGKVSGRRSLAAIRSRIKSICSDYRVLERDYLVGLVAYALVHVSIEDIFDPDFDLPSELSLEFVEQFRKIGLSPKYQVRYQIVSEVIVEFIALAYDKIPQCGRRPKR